MRERLLWLVPILESMVCAVLGARYACTFGRELEVDLEEAYEHLMRARTALSRAARTEARELARRRSQN